VSELEITAIGSLISKEAKSYAISRKYAHKQDGHTKVALGILAKEIEAARVIGEMSGAERVLTSLVANPEWTREDLEAELQIFVVKCNNQVVETLKQTNLRTTAGKIIEVTDVLESHNYYK